MRRLQEPTPQINATTLYFTTTHISSDTSSSSSPYYLSTDSVKLVGYNLYVSRRCDTRSC
jgi:hypothetical protein